MAQPDTPNFSPVARVFMGVLVIAVIYLLLHFLAFIP
jgi:hypothetical protein